MRWQFFSEIIKYRGARSKLKLQLHCKFNVGGRVASKNNVESLSVINNSLAVISIKTLNVFNVKRRIGIVIVKYATLKFKIN